MRRKKNVLPAALYFVQLDETPMRFRPWAGCFADSLQPLEGLPSCCVCSSLSSHTSILPRRPVNPLHLPPPPHPLSFLRSTGLMKVSQSPVALLYRLLCFLLKWTAVSCEYPSKEWERCFHPPFVWLLWCQITMRVHRCP